MELKIVFQYDQDNYFQGTVTLDSSDKSPSGSWNIPAGCTEIAPPENKADYKIKWNGTTWEYEEIPQEPEPEPPTLEELKEQALSYQYQLYEEQKHAIVWITDGSGYGFDCAPEDQLNWHNAMQLMQDDVTMYRVYTDVNNLKSKIFTEVTRIQMMEAGELAKVQQYAAYIGFEEVQGLIEVCTTAEELQPYLPPQMT